MKHRTLLSLSLLSFSLLGLGCVACGGQRAPAEASGARSMKAESSDVEASAEARDEDVAPALAPHAAEPTPPAEKSAESPSAAVTSSADELTERVRAFDERLEPSRLSCVGAKPHRDAICSIAERICTLGAPGPSQAAPEDCREARKSCEEARSRYKARCGE